MAAFAFSADARAGRANAPGRGSCQLYFRVQGDAGPEVSMFGGRGLFGTSESFGLRTTEPLDLDPDPEAGTADAAGTFLAAPDVIVRLRVDRIRRGPGRRGKGRVLLSVHSPRSATPLLHRDLGQQPLVIYTAPERIGHLEFRTTVGRIRHGAIARWLEGTVAA